MSVEIAASFLPCDVNGDGAATDADEVLLMELTMPEAVPTTEQLSAGDLNGDGKLTQPDVVLLKRLLEGLPVDESN